MSRIVKSVITLISISLCFLTAGCPTDPGDPGITNSITIQSPSGSEVWLQGSTHLIEWEFDAGSDTTLEIRLNRGSNLVAPINLSVSNTGSYKWEIPVDLAPASDYQIYIKSGATEAISAPFAVVLAAPELGLSDLAHNFGTIEDGTGETTWTFDVWNSGTEGRLLEFQAVADKDWITLVPPSGTSLGTNDVTTITVTIAPTLLSVGKNSGRITVSATGLPPKIISITAMKPLTAIGRTLVSAHDFGFSDSQWTFDLWNAGEAGTTLDYTVFSDKAWLLIDPETGTSTGEDDINTITVTVNRDVLPAISNSANVTINAPGLPSERISITASQAIPAIGISGTAYDFGSDASEWTFDVWNAGDIEADLDFEVYADKEWLTIAPISGTSIDSENRQSITVNIDRTALTSGNNSGNITVSADGVQSKTIRITATKSKPALSISSDTYDYGLDATEWSFDIWNSGDPDATLEFVIFANKEWITIVPDSGTSTGFADKKTITVTIDRLALTPGENSGTITVSAAEGLNPQTIAITATEPEPSVKTSGQSYDFGTGGTEWSFDVWGTGDPTATHIFSISTDKDWITVDPSSATSTGSDDPQTIDVTIDRSSLKPGENTATIAVSAEGLVSSLITINASKAQPEITVSGTSYGFGSGGTSWTFDVWNSGDTETALEFLVSTDKEWLTANPASGTSADDEEPVTITLTVDRSVADIGNHTGTVTVLANGIESQEIAVTMTKTQPAIGIDLVTVHDFGLVDTTWTFDIWNDGAVDSVMEFSVFADKNWVTLSPVSSSSTGADDVKTITVTVDRSKLASGTNSSIVTISSEGLPSKTVRVTATKAKPVISVSSISIDFSTTVDDWSFDVWNSGDSGSTLDFQVSTDMEWLSVEPGLASSTGVDDIETIAVSVNRSQLPHGTSTGKITVIADGVTPKIISVKVTKAQPSISISGTSYDFGLTDSTWTFDVWNSGDASSSLDFIVSTNTEWISCDPLSSTSADDEDAQTITVTIDRALLPSGINTGTITISSGDLQIKTISIKATQPLPDFTVSGTSYDFGTTGTTWTFDVWSSGDPGTSLDFIISSDKEWITFDPDFGESSGPDDRSTITVTINRTLLSGGTFTGKITVFSSSSSAQEQINITASKSQPTIAVSGAMFDFETTQTTGSFDIWNSDDTGTTLHFAISPNKEWLTASFAAGSTNTSTGPDDPQTINITVDRSKLDEGVNTGTISISTDATSQKTVTVTASTPQPEIAVSSAIYDFEYFDSEWSFNVWNASELGTTLEFSASSNKEWIILDPTTGTSTGPTDKATLDVTVDRTKLLSGTNTGIITISTLSSGSKTISIKASTPKPEISMSATTYNFGKSETTWSFEVWNSGHTGTTLDFTAEPEKDWISCTPSSATSTDPDDRQTINVTIDRSKLTVGSNSGRIFLNCPLCGSKSVSLSASTPVPAITVSSSSHDFAVGESIWTFDVWNSGDAGTKLEFEATSNQSWISLDPDRGESDDSTDQVEVEVTIDRASIPDGTTTGSVTIIASNGPTKTINLKVLKPTPDITVSGEDHDFGTSTTTWAFDVWNSGDVGTTLNFQVSDDQLWIAVSPDSGSSTGPADRATINVTIDRGILSSDTNTGKIYISSLDLTPKEVIDIEASVAKALFVVKDLSVKKSDDRNPEEFDTIQEAIDAAAKLGIQEIWVEEGTYYETVTMKEGISLYGGFAGGFDSERTDRDDRDWEAYPTIINGEDMRPCVIGAADTVLDGFTITHGLAETGGGMSNVDATISIDNCIFVENFAILGAAIYNVNSDLSISNCIIKLNITDDPDGGVIYLETSSAIISDSIIRNNTSEAFILDEKSYLDVSNSDIQEGIEGAGIIDVDPVLLDPGK